VAGIAPFPFARTAGAAPIAAGPVEDAVSALVNLGYRRVDAYAAVLKALDSLGESAPVASLVRSGLQILGKETAR
jgi:Holliday junction DNA helicase RuvA